MSAISLNFAKLSAELESIAPIPERPDLGRIDFHAVRHVGDHLTEAICHVRSLRNLSSPLARLPPEILMNIMRLLQPDIPSHSPLPLSFSLYECAAALSVCRYLRNIALSAPFLWNRIHLSDDLADPATTWFRRSLSAPSFKLYYTGTLPAEASELEPAESTPLLEMLSEMSRLEELHISSKWVRNSALWELLRRPAPSLRSFSFIMAKENTSGNVGVLPCVFNDDMPMLENIALAFVSSWPYNHFRNLTRFSLYDQPVEARQSFPAFLEFLSASPHLQELVIVRAGPSCFVEEADWVDSTSPFVTLPSLQYLEIGDNVNWLSYTLPVQLLLKHLIAPSTTERCFWEYDNDLSIRDYFCQNMHALASITKIVLTQHQTYLKHKMLIAIKGSTLYCNTEPFERLMVDLSPESSPFPNVEELVFAQGYTRIIDFTNDLLRLLPFLRTISIAGSLWSSPSSLLDRFALLDEAEDGQKHFKYAPRLEHLHIFPLDQTRRVLGWYACQPIIALARLRADHGCPLKSITLQRYDKDTIERIRQLLAGTLIETEVGMSGLDVRDVWLLHHREW